MRQEVMIEGEENAMPVDVKAHTSEGKGKKEQKKSFSSSSTKFDFDSIDFSAIGSTSSSASPTKISHSVNKIHSGGGKGVFISGFHDLVLFDGTCNLCNASVDFLIQRDKNR